MTAQHHDELFLAIGRLEGKVDSLIALQGHQQEQIKEHDSRIRVLEHSRSHLMGWAAAIGAVLGISMNYLIRILSP